MRFCAFSAGGLWGFLSKVAGDSAGPLQLQILFTLGMLPVAVGMLVQMRWKLDRNVIHPVATQHVRTLCRAREGGGHPVSDME
jgi:hypothetical protein